MGYVVRTDLLGVLNGGDGLENAFGTDADGVGAAAKHIAKDHIANALFVIGLRDVECGMTHGSEGQGALFNVGEFGFVEAAGIGNGGIDVVAFLFREIFHGKRGVEPAAEGKHHFLSFHKA